MTIDNFSAIANKYDFLNDLMSFGIHRRCKNIVIDLYNLQRESLILDIAGGTGDISFLLAKKRLQKDKIILTDINESMLNVARKRLFKECYDNISIVQADVENLPFNDAVFDCVFVGFGVRNFLDKQKALTNIYRVLKNKCSIIILEFSKPKGFLYKKLWLLYVDIVIPLLGKIFCTSPNSYYYLRDSIHVHPMQEEFKELIERAGYVNCYYRNLFGGIVAIHVGFKN